MNTRIFEDKAYSLRQCSSPVVFDIKLKAQAVLETRALKQCVMPAAMLL